MKQINLPFDLIPTRAYKLLKDSNFKCGFYLMRDFNGFYNGYEFTMWYDSINNYGEIKGEINDK